MTFVGRDRDFFERILHGQQIPAEIGTAGDAAPRAPARGVWWRPICLTALADEFAQEHFPALTASQGASFLRAIYTDGFDKAVTHSASSIIDRLGRTPNDQGNLCWFLMGLSAHVPPDTFAHAGKFRSFVVPQGSATTSPSSWSTRS
jgi:hypothetical protein